MRSRCPGPHDRGRGQLGYASAMSVKQRNHVQVSGSGPATMFFAHGFGCDQNMWRLLAPVYAKSYRTVLFDLDRKSVV